MPRIESLVFRSEMMDDKLGKVYIQGPICAWASPIFNETDPKQVENALNAVKDAEKLEVYIDSPGGYLEEGKTLMRLIKEHGAKEKHAICMQCASAATLIPLACQRVSAYEGGEFLFHNPSGGVHGTPKEIIQYGTGLQKKADGVAELYEKRMNKTLDEIKEMMDQETWMTPAEARDCGYVDDIIPISESDGITMSASMDQEGEKMMACLLGYTYRPHEGKTFMMSNPLTSAGCENEEAPKPASQESGGEEKMTAEELKSKFPDVYSGIYEKGRMSGVAEERQRLCDIDEMADGEDEQMIMDAKYGEKPMEASALAVMLLKQRKERKAAAPKAQNPGAGYMSQRKKETEQMNGIEGGSSGDNNPAQSEEDEAKEFAQMCSGFAQFM